MSYLHVELRARSQRVWHSVIASFLMATFGYASTQLIFPSSDVGEFLYERVHHVPSVHFYTTHQHARQRAYVRCKIAYSPLCDTVFLATTLAALPSN
jgi:hypothetical protein